MTWILFGNPWPGAGRRGVSALGEISSHPREDLEMTQPFVQGMLEQAKTFQEDWLGSVKIPVFISRKTKRGVCLRARTGGYHQRRFSGPSCGWRACWTVGVDAVERLGAAAPAPAAWCHLKLHWKIGRCCQDNPATEQAYEMMGTVSSEPNGSNISWLKMLFFARTMILTFRGKRGALQRQSLQMEETD